MKFTEIYLIACTTIFVFFGAIWKTDTAINVFIKFLMIYMAIQGMVLLLRT